MTQKERARKHYLANKEAYLARSKAQRLADPTASKKYMKEYSVKNRTRLQEQKASWVAANAELNRRYKQKYATNNPGKVNANARKYKASKAKRTPPWLSKEQLREIEQFYVIAKDLSWLSLEPLEVDHIVPLRGKIVSGLHVPWNLQILPKSDNEKKRNKWPNTI